MAETPVIKTEVEDRFNGRVVKEGWLEMCGAHIKTWRRRYFILLKDAQLLGFKKSQGPHCHSRPCHLYNLHWADIKFGENDPDHTRSIFTITMPFTNPKDKEFTRTFAAENDGERDCWANAINKIAFEEDIIECFRIDYVGEMSGENQQDYLNTMLQ